VNVDRDAVVIEVGLNEAVPKALNPLVPESPTECADDARRCVEAGATVVHWHARDSVGAERLGDASLYGAALDAMGRGVIAYPSYPVDVPDTVDERLAHCFLLRERHGLELGPIDVGSVTIVHRERERRSIAGGNVVVNSLPFVVDALDRYRAVGLVPSLGAFDIGFTRTAAALAEAGHLAEPLFCKIFLWGALAIGPEPTAEALDLHLRQLPPDLDVEWVVVPRAIDDPALVEQLCRTAIERGGGVRVGIGDNPLAHPGSSNAHVARWAADAGRPVASPDGLRRRLGIPAG
jgi:uncharacterized protein (DUF849 family)